MPFELPALPYDYASLEPHVDARTMEIHHGKHHAAYVANLNLALEGSGFETKPLAWLLENLNQIPDAKRQAVRNNAGGHANHTLFWELLSPKGGGEPRGELANAIEDTFGDFEAFKQKFEAEAKSRFGSGWAWLAIDKKGVLEVFSLPNQDSPLMEGKIPLLGLDVWEHAYYLHYQNRRPDYISAFWKMVNWGKVSDIFLDH